MDGSERWAEVPESPERDERDETPARVMVISAHRLTLSNGRTVQVKVMRPQDAAPWSEADEAALRAILNIAAAATTPGRPRLVS